MKNERMINWKKIAIIFIILFSVESIIILYSVYTVFQENKETRECYYNICEVYPEATYEDNLCTCYDYDILGYLVPEKYKIIK